MHAIVVGHRGLIGSAMARHMEALGVTVTRIDRSNYAERVGDQVDVLINASGSSDKRLASSDPRAAFTANVDSVMATLSDFKAVHYMLISSVDVYSDRSSRARTTEDQAVDVAGLSSYGAQKLVAEMLVRAYAKRWTIARLGPVVGPGLKKNAVFDLLARSTLFVHPDSEYPYIHTSDAARLVAELLDDRPGIYNVSARGTIRLRRLAAELGVSLGPEHELLPNERYEIDTAKLAARHEVPSTENSVRRFVSEFRALSAGSPSM